MLEPLLVEKREEAAVLARGSVLRDHYVDWNPEDRANAVGDGHTRGEVTTLVWLVIAVLMAIAGILHAMK